MTFTAAQAAQAADRVQAQVPVADGTNVDRAVAAAREALPGWRALPLHQRMAALHRLADLLVAHRAEAAAINALDNGTPAAAVDPGSYTASWVRYYATSSTVRWSPPTAARASTTSCPSLRGGGGDRAVERPHDGHGAEGGPRPRRRQHGRGQAAGDRALRGDPLRRAGSRGGHRARRAQRRSRRGGGGRGAGAPPRRRQGVVHRRHGDGPPGDGGGGRDPQALGPRAGRQVGQRDLPGRRTRPGRHRIGVPRGHAAERPGVRPADPALRPRRRLRRGGRTGRGPGRVDAGWATPSSPAW